MDEHLLEVKNLKVSFKVTYCAISNKTFKNL